MDAISSKQMYVSFNGKRNTRFGVKMLSRPVRQSATPRGKLVTIDGRDGGYWLDDDSEGTIKITQEFAVEDPAMEHAALAWLKGSGRLTFGDDPDYGYRARVTNIKNLTALTPRLAGMRFVVTFTCQPFRFLVNEEAVTVTESGTQFEGMGSDPSLPVIEIQGSGDVNLMVNSTSVLIEGIQTKYVLDCDARMGFDKDGNNASAQATLLRTNSKAGGWPTLRSAAQVNHVNQVSWTGSVSQVVITPNWRFR